MKKSICLNIDDIKANIPHEIKNTGQILGSTKRCAANIASSSDSIIMGILLHPGDFNKNSIVDNV